MTEPEEQDEEQIEEAEDDDEVDLEDLEGADGEVTARLALADDDDDESEDDDGLDELLSQRSTPRRPAEPDEDEDDIMALASDREPKGGETIVTKVLPIKDRQEFVCRRCYLVKARVQLADAERMLCRDCV